MGRHWTEELRAPFSEAATEAQKPEPQHWSQAIPEDWGKHTEADWDAIEGGEGLSKPEEASHSYVIAAPNRFPSDTLVMVETQFVAQRCFGKAEMYRDMMGQEIVVSKNGYTYYKEEGLRFYFQTIQKRFEDWRKKDEAKKADIELARKVDTLPFRVKNGFKRIKDSNGEEVYAHRFVAEKVLGRTLEPKEFVTHLDGNKLNNAIENLRVHTGYRGKGKGFWKTLIELISPDKRN